MSNRYIILFIRGAKMVNDLLYISKELLNYLNSNNNLNEYEKKYILSIIHKIIIISMIELNGLNRLKTRTTIPTLKTINKEERNELYKELTKKNKDIYKKLSK